MPTLHTPLLIAGCLTLLAPTTSHGQDLNPASQICNDDAGLCQTRQRVQGLAESRPGPSTLCQSHSGLCWQQEGAQKLVNWRLTRQLYGSTSAGSDWGHWRLISPQQRISAWNHCQRSERNRIVYRGPCQMEETSPQSDRRTLKISFQNSPGQKFIWKGGNYWSATTHPPSQLVLREQGTRLSLQWSTSILVASQHQSDLALPEVEIPTDRELEAQFLGTQP